MNPSDRHDSQSAVRLVIEVDGNPVGFLEIEIDRLWPLIDHQQRNGTDVEWIDPKRLKQAMRATVIRHLINRLQPQLYGAIGNEIVKAELDIESFMLKADAAGQAFGRTRKDLDALLSENERSAEDFEAFFWEYMLDDREGIDPKKEWKARLRG